MNVRQRAPDAAGDGFSTISSEPAYTRATPGAGEAAQPPGFGGLTDTGRRGGKGHATEWDAEAIVWKVKQLAQPKNRAKLVVAVAVAALLLVGGVVWSLSASPKEEELEARVEAATQDVKPPVVDNTALITGCVSTCRTRVACDPPCREYRARSPRCVRGARAGVPGVTRASSDHRVEPRRRDAGAGRGVLLPRVMRPNRVAVACRHVPCGACRGLVPPHFTTLSAPACAWRCGVYACRRLPLPVPTSHTPGPPYGTHAELGARKLRRKCATTRVRWR